MSEPTPEIPFAIDLIDGDVFVPAAVVRYVPGRRWVIKGRWRGHEVYVKVFSGNRASRHAQRDAAGISALLGAGILAPALLYAGALGSANAQVLVYEAIHDASNLLEVYEGLSDQQDLRFQLAQRLITVVASHHQAGLVQSDLYLKNFLLQGERIVTLDGDGIRQFPSPLGRRRSLNNLALLLSKLDALDFAAWLPALLAAYASARSWRGAPESGEVAKLVNRLRRKVTADYADHKVFRECGDVHVEQSWRHFLAISKAGVSSDLAAAMRNADALLDDPSAVVLKDGRTCTVALCEIGGCKVVIKRYNIRNIWHGLGRAFRRSRAAVSWSNAHRLKLYGIATPAPVALFEARYGGLRRQAYFIARYLAAPDASQFLADPNVGAELKKIFAERLARLMHRMSVLGVSHGDMKSTNIKVVDACPILIDLDSMQDCGGGWWAARRHVRDLRRLMHNWRDNPEILALLRRTFYNEYQDRAVLAAADINP